MINKKTIPVVALLLLLAVAAVIAAGASQTTQYTVPAGNVVLATGAATDSGTTNRTIPAAPALPAATGQVLFSDDFGASALKGWHNLPEAAGLWKVISGGVLQQAGSDADGSISDEDSVLVTDDSSFADSVFESQVYPTAGDPVGVVFR